jgi:outer membrane biosynthesis protein TonB
VLELIEKVLASLIILGMLVVIMFLAIDKNGGTDRVQAPDTQTQTLPTVQETAPVVPDPNTPPPSKPVEAPSAPKSNLPPAVAERDQDGRKTMVEKLPKSRVAEKPRAAKPRKETRIARMPPEDKRRYLTRAHYRDPWRRTDYYECDGGYCDCSCRRPYWARSGPCWD